MKKLFGGLLAAALVITFASLGSGQRWYAVPAGAATVPPPLCFTNAAGVFVCNVPGYGPAISTASPVPQAAATTGTTAYVWQVAQTMPATCGFAPSGNCIVMVKGYYNYPSAAPTAEAAAACIAASPQATSVPSIGVGNAWTNSNATAAPCQSAVPVGTPLAGTAPFALATTGINYAEGALTAQAEWDGTIPTNTTWNFLCEVEGSTTASMTINTACAAIVIPF